MMDFAVPAVQQTWCATSASLKVLIKMCYWFYGRSSMQPGKWGISEGAGEWRPSTWLHVCVGNEDNDETGEQRSEIPPWDTLSTRALEPWVGRRTFMPASFDDHLDCLVSEVKICAALRWRFERVSYKFLSMPKMLLFFSQMYINLQLFFPPPSLNMSVRCVWSGVHTLRWAQDALPSACVCVFTELIMPLNCPSE